MNDALSLNIDRFYRIIEQYCTRKGVDKLVEYLENLTDFFIAPASTKYHLSCRGGLLQHSLDVYDTLINVSDTYGRSINKESLVIVSLFHDLCKTNFYKKEIKSVKNAGQWVNKEVYVIDDEFPIGHGEKSVIMLQKFIQLTKDEMLAIRWHMNGFDCAVKGGEYAYSTAIAMSPLVTLLQVADLISSQILENKENYHEKRN